MDFDSTRPDSDTGTHSDTQAIAGWLNSLQASLFLSELGVPRTPKTVRRFCRKDIWDCKRIENNLRQMEWRVHKNSVEAFAEEQKTLLQVPGQTRTGELVSESDLPTNASPNKVSLGQPEPAKGDHERVSNTGLENTNKDGHTDKPVSIPSKELEIVLRENVTDLKKQLDVKDNQIASQHTVINTMLERDRETNILIQNLQGLLTGKQLESGEEGSSLDKVSHVIRELKSTSNQQTIGDAIDELTNPKSEQSPTGDN